MTAYNPLHGLDTEPPFPAPLSVELELAREYLVKVAAANIHDHMAMVKAASGLDYRMRALLAAFGAERGEGK